MALSMLGKLSMSGKVMVASTILIIVLLLLELFFPSAAKNKLIAATKFTNEELMWNLGTNPFWFWYALFLVMLNHFLNLFHLQSFEKSGALAKSVIILHVWYDKQRCCLEKPFKSEPMMISCFLIFVDRCILGGLVEELKICFEEKLLQHGKTISDWMAARTSHIKEPVRRLSSIRDRCLPCFKSTHINTYTDTMLKEPLLVVDDPEKNKEDRKLMAENVYQDFRKSFSRCVLTFLIQAGLILYYVFEMSGSDSTKDGDLCKTMRAKENVTDSDDDNDLYILMTDPKKVSMVKWLLAVTITMIVKAEDTGRSFGNESWRFWEYTQKKYEEESEDNEKKHRQERNILSLGFHLCMRAFMDWWINSAMFAIIIATFPILLAVQEPLEFLKDVTALFFILKLDDLEEPVEITNVKNWNELPKKDAAFTWLTLRRAVQARTLPVSGHQQNTSVRPGEMQVER